MADLKPCPFCGGEELGHGYSWPPMQGNVQCYNCDAYIIAETEAGAIAAWNARPGEDAAFAAGREAGLREAMWIVDTYANDALQPAEGWSDDERAAWENGGIDHCSAIRDAILALIEKGEG